MRKRKEFNRETEGLANKVKRIKIACSKGRVGFLSLLKEDLKDIQKEKEIENYTSVISSIETLIHFMEFETTELNQVCGIKTRNKKTIEELEKEVAKLKKRIENKKAA